MAKAKRDVQAVIRAEALQKEAARLTAALGSPGTDDMAFSARLPELVLGLTAEERARRVRQGSESILVDDASTPGGRRGFVRAVLRVPLGHPQGAVYGVFVEVDRTGYLALKRAYETKQEIRVSGRLATKLPLLEEAYDTRVEIIEDGSERRARVVGAEHRVLQEGPAIGPRVLPVIE